MNTNLLIFASKTRKPSTFRDSRFDLFVGRGGCVIKQIQKESETRINFKDDNEESGDELTEEAKPRSRTMVIRGSRERIKHAEVLIKKIIDEQPVMEKISVEIPQRVIGRIIGKGGKTIRQLCRISGISFRPIFSVANSPQPLLKGLP